MGRGENYLLAVFRRRNSCRDLNRSKPGGNDTEEQPKVPEGGPVEKEKQEETTPDSVDTNCLVVQRATSFYEDSVNEEDQPAIPLKARPLQSDLELSGSHLGDRGDLTCASDLKDSVDDNLKEPELTGSLVLDKPKVWTSDTTRLGWIPGRVKRVDKNRYVVEPVVAVTEALADICLDDSLINAMAGKRGSFSSERSVRTDESDGSETKRARVWSSVFRMRGGNPP